MRLSQLKRARYYLPVTLFVLLATAGAVVFHPDIQKKLLLKQVGPLVDHLELGHVQITPWSLAFDQLSVDYRGGQFRVAHGTLRYCLSSLLWRNLDIRKLLLRDVQVDLRTFKPPDTTGPEQPAGVFPGVLGSLDHGFGYTLWDADINAEILLPAGQALTASITGTGIRPEATGALTLQTSLRTGTGDDHIDLDSRIYLTQLTRGRFRALDSFSAVTAALQALPAPERAAVEFSVRPAATPGDVTTYPPETLALKVRQSDDSGEKRADLDLLGDYDGNTALFTGSYRIAANQRLVQPYIGDKPVPSVAQTLTGALNFNLAVLTGDMTITSNLLISELREAADNARLPELLRLENNLRVALLPDRQLVVETLDSGLTDEVENRPLTTRLPQNVQVPLDDLEGFLHREQTLLEFELPVVPLTWFDVLLPDSEITAGTLTGAFAITTDSRSVLHVKPLRPLRIDGLAITRADGSALAALNLTVLPGASYSKDALQVVLDKLDIAAGKESLAHGKLDLTMPLAAAGTIRAHAEADLDSHHLATLLSGKRTRNQSLPRHLALHAETRLRQQSGQLSFDELTASLATRSGTRLLNLQLQQPLRLADTGQGMHLAGADGKLATLALSDIQLGWFSAFVPDTTLRGRLYRANFTLAAESPDIITLTPDRPFRLSDVTVTGPDGPLLEALGISVLPDMRLAPDGTSLRYRDLRVTGGSATLANASGTVTLPAADRPLLAAGHLELDLQGLSRQPLLAGVLQAALAAPARLQADYRLAQSADHVDISQLDAGVFYSDTEPRIALQADAGIRIPTRLNRRRSVLGGSRGKLTLGVANLTPEPFADILAAQGIAFDAINASVVLDTDGRKVTVDSMAPMVINGLAAHSETGALLRPCTVTADASATLQGDRLHATLENFSVDFARNSDQPALQGHADVVLTGNSDATRAESAQAELSLQLPELLEQPALLPGHTLQTGRMQAFLQLGQDGRLTASAQVQDLGASQELPLQSLLWRIDGRLDPDGSFSISAPLTTTGKSGSSTLRIMAEHSARTAENHAVALNLDSPVFYLNDILNTLKAIAGRVSSGDTDHAATGRQTAATGGTADSAPDTRAAWDRTVYNVQASISMDRLFYTDYLEFTAIRGHASSLPDRLALNNFEAHFHESPITMDGTLAFRDGALPYQLQLQAAVRNFDLARFFRELAPGSTPQAEGLFDVHIDAHGESPNLAQYRNNLFFDARLQSHNGTFRLLDPDSPLVAGSTGLAGGFGEVVSYVPTGLFGLGAVSRLVNYIKEIDYDKVVVELARDASRDVQIKQYVVQNPEVLMTASGGISFEPGTDILQSPLSLDARLNLREKGAAIFYDLDLLHSKHDEWGYWLGPAIHFRGTPANPESNLDDIISDAGKGAFLGAITRPISGLIGNIRHRWIDEEPERKEYPTEDIR